MATKNEVVETAEVKEETVKTKKSIKETVKSFGNDHPTLAKVGKSVGKVLVFAAGAVTGAALKDAADKRKNRSTDSYNDVPTSDSNE